MPRNAGNRNERAAFETLPQQEKFFATSRLKRSARAGTQLPDPTHAPYGYDPSSQFKHLFPALELPMLKPPASHHPEDHVSFGSPELPPHELFLGDNLYLLRQMPSESVALIYIDPPFFSNRTYTQIWGDDNEVRSFNDIFADGMFSYLAWLNARLWEMKRVLKPTGSIYVHCDWHASHYIKCEMDKIFGYENFVSEIIWRYSWGIHVQTRWNRKHDVILMYSKSDKITFNALNVLEKREDEVLRRLSTGVESATMAANKSKSEDRTKKLPADVWDVPTINGMAGERIGYPTQKPEALLERIIKASSNKGDTVADFFMGGGTTGAVALKLNRRFVGCDISRVAVSVSASRLIDIAEELSGITVTKEKTQTLGMKLKPVADIQIGYVGSYPIDKFRGIAQEEFTGFVLHLYQASAFTGKARYIHGIANGKLVVSVGPADPDAKVSAAHVKGFTEEVLRQYQTQFARGEEKILQIIGWGFAPETEPWKGQAVTALNKQNVKLQIELVSLSSESFRQKIFRHVGEANIDLKFNRLNQLLSFTSGPYAGKIKVVAQDGLKFVFRLEGAKSIGTGRLINCQWDFSYDGSRFASREHALNREKKGQGEFEAVFEVEHAFPNAGEYRIAARVQDNLDGTVYLIDSTTIELCLSVFKWATFVTTKAAVKVHTMLDLKGSIPAFFHISKGNVHDVNFLDLIDYEIGAYYVMDRGYLDYERLYKIHKAGAFFVTRSKHNTAFTRLYSNQVDKTTGVRCDQVIKFSGYQAAKDYPDKLRRIKYVDKETNHYYVFLTNDFNTDAKIIADLYKHRWQIELFFKWIKGHLRITAFWGHSANAVQTHICIAICSYLIVAIMKKQLHIDRNLNEILQILNVSSFVKMPLFQLISETELQTFEDQSQKQAKLWDY